MQAEAVAILVMRADPNLSGFGGRFVAGVRDQGVELPAVVVTCDEDEILSGANPASIPLRRAIVDATVHAATAQLAAFDAEIVERAFQGFKSEDLSGWIVRSRVLGVSTEEQAPEDGAARGWASSVVEIELWYQET